MAYEQPLYEEDLDYSAKQLRQLPSAMWQAGGVLGSTQLVATPGTGMTLNVTAGFVVVEGSTSAGQGNYLCPLSAAQSVTIPAAPGAGLSRVDRVVAQIQDNDEDSGGVNAWVITVIEGTAAASSPAAPTIPASCEWLYNVTTSGTQTSLTAANITDERRLALAWNDMPGEVRMWAHQPSAPMGWNYCDGTAVSRTRCPLLFAMLGTAFGAGDGSTTFNLPDFRGRAPIGYGAATTGTTARALASKVGEETHVLTTTEMPSHNHGNTTTESAAHNHHEAAIDVVSHPGSTENITPTVVTGVQGVAIDSGATTLTSSENQTHVHGTANAGSNGAHNNMQPSLVVGFIIRLA